MIVDEYLGFRAGDEVLDLAELTAGTARIKELHLVPSDWANGPTVIAVMVNGAERYVIQLKKVQIHAAKEPETRNRRVIPLRRDPH
ncbi:hypothetical protein JJL56_18190 [Azospirillum sp. YIM DDC1]|uniref:Uncharacterized protein n=2 Tax=Azospirillum TaxID=191 RepID=A0A235H822_AZOBR|nr:MULTISPECIES: hypothetical protein [Azospirillum]MBB3267855.1 hypothetical protein [Azospirillum sp. OGB3]MBK4720800.1 hypothetical protein [Azospirillum aestuarii]OYD81674.1 hypothetical protein CHT98_24590 [Azospirillum brasilense]QCO19111.1 hypothetical protein D3869_28115 [Azospirillum brasilense]